MSWNQYLIEKTCLQHAVRSGLLIGFFLVMVLAFAPVVAANAIEYIDDAAPGSVTSNPAVSDTVDSKWSVGVKGWANKWTQKTTITYEYTDIHGNTTSDKSAYSEKFKTLMIGPAFHYQYKKLFIDMIYLKSNGDYVYSESDKDFILGPYEYESKVAWKDVETKIGYRFSPEAGWYLGIKQLNGNVIDKFTFTSSGVVYDYRTVKISLLQIGGVGDGPIIGPLNYYWDACLLLGSSEDPDPEVDPSVNDGNAHKTFIGVEGEMGVSAALSENLSAIVGYKVQITNGGYNVSDAITVSIRDTFVGVTAGLNYNF